MKTDNLIREIVLAAHPVGSYYWSSEATSPATLFGGEWEQITDKFVYAAGGKKVGETGGEEEHALTEDELPKVSASLYVDSTRMGWNPAMAGGSVLTINTNYTGNNFVGVKFGGNQPHNNMPPYVAAYCWRRTA